MKGDRQVIEQRMQGQPMPSQCIDVMTDGRKPNPKWRQFGEHAEVSIEASDYPELLDLRFAFGLIVRVEGEETDRVDAIAKAFLKAKAARVMTTVFKRQQNQWGVSFDVVRLTDSAGEMVWPA